MVKTTRTVVEIRDELHGQIKRLALLNDLRIHEVANAAIANFLHDEQKIKATIMELRLRKEYKPAVYQREALKAVQNNRFAVLTKPAHTFSQFLHQHQ